MPHKKLEVLKMRDRNESYHKKKGMLFDLPMKVAIIGRSQLSGKSNLVGNLLLSEDPRLYRHEFEGTNIYIFSPTAKTDFKIRTMIDELEVPTSNVFSSLDENVLDALYEMIEDEFKSKVAQKQRPPHFLFYFDDVSASGDLKKHKNGALAKIVQNGRHVLISTIVTSQTYIDTPRFLRENMSGGAFFAGTSRQLEVITEDHSYVEAKVFKKMFRHHTNQPHSFMVVNYSNPPDARYMDTTFIPINPDDFNDC